MKKLNKNLEEAKMEDKYNPIEILGKVWNKFKFLHGYENSKMHEYDVFIEIKGSKDECYYICTEENKFPKLIKGPCKGSVGTEIKDLKNTLLNNKNLLGKTYIRFRSKIIEPPYSSYEEFWNDMGN